VFPRDQTFIVTCHVRFSYNIKKGDETLQKNGGAKDGGRKKRSTKSRRHGSLQKTQETGKKLKRR